MQRVFERFTFTKVHFNYYALHTKCDGFVFYSQYDSWIKYCLKKILVTPCTCYTWPPFYCKTDLNTEVTNASGLLCSKFNSVIQTVALGDLDGKGLTPLLLFMCEVYLFWQVKDEWFHKQQWEKWKLQS